MKDETENLEVQIVPISAIHILNPRSRNKRVHADLIDNIKLVGLKRPITVSKKARSIDGQIYDLVCGQGRIEAYLALGQTEIPAHVISASEEDSLVMSLVENVARRQHRPIDLMREVGRLRERGHTDGEIASRIGVTASWINMIGGLLERGEEKLLAAVETGLIPLSLATDIARSSETEIQALLTEAYELGFRGKKLSTLRRLLEARAKRDRLVRTNPMGTARSKKKKLTMLEMRQLFEQEAEKHRLMVKQAAFVHERLTVATQALKELLILPEFGTILREQKLNALPKVLASRVYERSLP
ncbi:MAG: plasmid partitioning protein RepB C-terminal domain-containing protein [Achromobacter sp.]|uniref:plasmid partitioning protein RepB C-terminal domain-containing protein n=1 Tax=Achromobacter sp. TaxID=134375 RepID=UPI003D051A7C